MRRRPAAIAAVVASAAAVVAVAFGAADEPAPAPVFPPGARPEVPGVARTLVPFGIETTTDGSRAWALGQSAGRTVVLQRAPLGGWASAALPVSGVPVGGTAPQHAGELAADGRGAILLADPEHPEADAQLLVRAPGAPFAAPPTADGVLESGERLVADATRPEARALLAVIGGTDSEAATLVTPTDGDGAATGVLRLDAEGWHREAIDIPVRPVALAAAGPTRAWLLGTAGDRVVLLHREPLGGDAEGDPHWVPTVPVGASLLAAAALPAAIASVGVEGAPADPLTVTSEGVWLDLRVTRSDGSAPVDVTEHLRVAEPPTAGEATVTPAPSAEPGATPTPTSTATPVPGMTATFDGRWCDLPAAASLCDHRLGFTFARGTRGYRSVAGPARPGAPFGVREISAPVDLGVAADARAREAQRQGGYAQLAGETFTMREGIGDDGSSTTQAIAFSADGMTGFTGGTVALGAVTAVRPVTVTDPPTLSLGDAIVSAAAAPNGDGRVFAMSRQGASLYTPGRGWGYANTGLTPTVANERYVTLRAVTWPRADVLVGVGSAGALVTELREPASYDFPFDRPSEDPQETLSTYRDLPVQATLLAVACSATDPLECTAVGRNGLIVRGNGTRWHIEHLPDAVPEATDITSVAYDGRTPLAATTAGLFMGGADGRWTRDDALHSALEADHRPAAVSRVATEPGGGTVVDGRYARDSASAPWRATSAPLDLDAIAIAAIRDGGTVRTIVSAVATAPPLPVPVVPDKDDGGASEDEEDHGPRHDPVPLDVSPVDAVVLRETADGWVDLDGVSFQASGGRDLPRTTPNTRAFVLDPAGTGFVLGGSSGSQTDPRLPDPLAATVSVRRLERGAAPAAAPAPETGESAPPAADSVRLAIGGHPACLDRCTGGAGQGLTPDLHLAMGVARLKAMVDAGAGPAALIVGGGRASLGGEPLDEAGARRYRELTQGAGVPTYVLPGPGDLAAGGDRAFAAGFADAAAPQGSGPTPESIDLSAITPFDPVGAPGARRVFAFDVRAAAGTVRVVAIDNTGGRFAGGPDGPQAQWLRQVMDGARERGIPVVVAGTASLDAKQRIPPAKDADEELELLIGHASAYVATGGVDDAEDAHFGGLLYQSELTRVGTDLPLAVFASSTLGYSPGAASREGEETFDEADFARQTAAALLLLDVAVGRIDSRTGVAPVTSLSEPLVGAMAIDTSVSKVPIGFAQPFFVTATDPASMRFLWRETTDAPPQPASASNRVYLPQHLCALWAVACDHVVPTNLTFSSSNPRVARFVAARRGDDSRDSWEPDIVLDASGHVIDDPRGVFCPLAAGTTDVTVTVAGRRVSMPIEVVTASQAGLPRGIRLTPIAPGTCGFPDFIATPRTDKPAAAAPETLTPAQPPAPLPIAPQPVQPTAPVPGPQSPHAPAPAPASPPAPALPAPLPPPAPLAPPAALVSHPPAGDPHPPVAPTGKPPAPPAPPAPPSGLSVQTAPASQAQPFQATQAQEQRRIEQAFEADSAAVAYAHPPSPLPWELLGGGAALALAIAGGSLVGHARRRVPVPAYASARRRG